jgi:hypothetical protein
MKKKLIEKHNITGIIEGFYHACIENTGMRYQGVIHLVVFKSKLLNSIEAKFHPLPVLSGWIPKLDNTKSKYDFILIPGVMMGEVEVLGVLPNLIDFTYLKILLEQNKHTGQMEVILEEEILN